MKTKAFEIFERGGRWVARIEESGEERAFASKDEALAWSKMHVSGAGEIDDDVHPHEVMEPEEDMES
jgi:hypothetical protein